MAKRLFKLGLATIVVGNGMFKPIISTVVGKLYDFGYTLLSSLLLVVYLVLSAYLAIMSKSGTAILRDIGVNATMIAGRPSTISRRSMW